MRYIFLVLFLAVANMTSIAQDNSKEILEAFKAKMERVQNYTADITIKVDVNFIKIKDRTAKIKFQAPDVYEIESDGFALLPKNSMGMESVELLEGGYTSILMGNEVVNGHNTAYIKVIPMNATGDIILAEMWIDEKNNLIRKMKSYSKDSGSFEMSFQYADHPYELPDNITIEFDIKNSKLPASMAGNFEALMQSDKEEETQGKVTINYANYVVNH